MHRLRVFIPRSCPKASCYPLLYLVLWLTDKTYQPPCYLMHDLRFPPPPSFLASGGTLCSRDTVKAVNFKRRSAGTSSKWHSRYLQGHGGISLLCWDPTFSDHRRHFSLCLKVIRMSVCMKVRRCYVRSLVRMENWKLSEQSLLWGWGREVPTKICFALSVLFSSLALPAKTRQSLYCSICALYTPHDCISFHSLRCLT